jgi:hypothetical protein
MLVSMSNILTKRETPQVLNAKRRKCLDVARKIPAQDLRILPLANAFGVGATTVRRWLNEAGIHVAARRGRPKAGQSMGFKEIGELVASCESMGQSNFDFAEQQSTSPDESWNDDADMEQAK